MKAILFAGANLQLVSQPPADIFSLPRSLRLQKETVREINCHYKQISKHISDTNNTATPLGLWFWCPLFCNHLHRSSRMLFRATDCRDAIHGGDAMHRVLRDLVQQSTYFRAGLGQSTALRNPLRNKYKPLWESFSEQRCLHNQRISR